MTKRLHRGSPSSRPSERTSGTHHGEVPGAAQACAGLLGTGAGFPEIGQRISGLAEALRFIESVFGQWSAVVAPNP